MGSTAEHQKLVDDLLLAFGSMLDVRVWPRPVGFDEHRKIKYGRPGETDIDGIIAPYGRRLGIEVKTGNARLSKKQIIWKAMILKFGGLYIEARSVEQALAEFKSKR